MTDDIGIGPYLVVDLCRMINQMHIGSGDNWKRLRIAISPEEDEALRKYFVADIGAYVQRLKGIPLIVEPNPKEHGPILIRA